MINKFNNILITGASSGIGSALALAHAAPGVGVHLLARNAERLETVAGTLRAAGASAECHIADVTDAGAMRRVIEGIDAASPLDLVIANAGISAGTDGGDAETEVVLRRILATNIDGVINTLMPALPRMADRRHGQVAIMASLAGFRGIPGSSAYSAGKAAVRVYGEALRAEMAPHGVGVTVICPGYINTPMTAVNQFKMPFLLSAERAAALMTKGIARNKARIVVPWQMGVLAWLGMALPASWTDLAIRRFPRKPKLPDLA